MKCSNGGIVASLRARAPSFIIPSDEVSDNDSAKEGLMSRLNTSDIILLTILAGRLLIVDSQILVALR